MDRRKGLFPYGYGRGWDEEKATTPWTRLWQMGREPATTRTYFWAFIVILPTGMLVMSLLIDAALAPS